MGDHGTPPTHDADRSFGPTGSGPLSDAELTALALAADPSAPPDPGAVPMADYLGLQDGLLPPWYMPPPVAGGRRRWALPVVVSVVAALVGIEAAGLCSTFGPLIPH